MKKYSELKEYIAKKQEEYTDKVDFLNDYQMFCRINQMYHELEQVKLSYERVIQEDFKKELIVKTSQARQCLYNTINGNPRKQDLIDGINYAIKDLNEILDLNKE